jgi:predicted AAA+ superfamily ATPase
VWLLRQLANIPSSVILDKNAIFDEYNWLFTEQFVLQNLNQYQMFYWTSWNQAEVDFVAQIDDKIVPIEVKSGENVKSKSLGIFTEKYNPNIAIRFSLKNTKLDEKLFNIALYHSFLFEKILKTI